MKKTSIILSMTILPFLFSCEQETRTAQDGAPTDVAQDRTEERLEVREDQMSDRQEAADVIIESANANMFQVNLSQHAAENATDEQVREYAAQVARHHSQAGEQLQSLAQQNDISLPKTMDDPQKERISEVTEKTGKEYDQEYLDEMVSSHKNEIDRLEKLAEEGADPSIREWASSFIPTVRQHQQEAEQLQEKYNGGGATDLME